MNYYTWLSNILDNYLIQYSDFIHNYFDEYSTKCIKTLNRDTQYDPIHIQMQLSTRVYTLTSVVIAAMVVKASVIVGCGTEQS